MMRIFALFYLIGFGTCQAKTTPCCVPVQWEGWLGTSTLFSASSSNPDIQMTSEKFSFDYTNKRIAANYTASFAFSPTNIKLRILENFSTKKTMTVQNGACTIVSNDGVINHCLPDNATALGDHNIGSGTDALLLNTWIWKDKYIEREIRVAKEGCIPLYVRNTQITTSLAYNMMGAYWDVTEGITDDSVFITPPECRTTKLQKFQDLPPHIQKVLTVHRAMTF